ncbi:hypothetical protein FS764_16425 [Agrobacterium vitis]|uniref:hypothetical protein n=1 Tax=Agrobacterium vitis TaxID=373 RepID=UPI001F206CB8|nr:hypothetical protein [Agrobacterium vitis]MCF1468494.1 hypothetical protein [Agrobacterium vitis]
MAQPYPISRETREEAIFLGDGGSSYGPFGLKIFDSADVLIYTKATGETVWTEQSVTITKASDEPFDEFSIAFAGNIPNTTKIKVISARVHERTAGLMQGVQLSPDALEKELTKVGTILQELARDRDRSIKMDFDAGAGLTLAPSLVDGDTLMKSGSSLVKGPNAEDIAGAQGNAAIALAAKEAAEAAAATATTLVGKANTALQAPDYYYPLAQLDLPVARARPDAPTVYDWDWTAVINTALAAGKSVLLPEGVTGVTGLTVIDMSRIKGVHHRRSILKLLNGSNKHIISTANFDAQFGTVVSTVVPQGQVLRNFSIDGNRANNNIIAANGVVANGIALYARKMSIVNVNGYNIPGHFIACDYRDTASGSIAPGDNGMLGMEGEFRNLWADFVGGHGMWMYGPHDSFLANCHMLHCSMNANNTYDDFHFELSFSARGYNLHGYNSGLYNNHRYGIYDAAGCDIDASHFEGSATANVYIKGQRGVYTSIRAYSPRGALYNVIIGGNQNRFSGYLGGAASGSCIGVRLGLDGTDYSAGNVVDVIAVDQNSGTIDFTYSQGNNQISVSGTQASGSAYVGTPPISEVLDMQINGVWYRQKGNAAGNNITAGGTSSSDATPLTARANRITAVTGNAGVKLPSSLMLVGETIFIFNATSSPIKIYTTGSDAIEYPGNSFPTPFTLAAYKGASVTPCFRGHFGAIVTA